MRFLTGLAVEHMRFAEAYRSGVVKWGRAVCTLFVWMAMALVTACTPAIQTPAPRAGETPTVLPDEFHAEMLGKRTLWRRQAIPSYRIRFEFIEDAAHPVVTRRDVFIGNFTIRFAQCPPGACPKTIFKDTLTVNDIFTLMQSIPESCVNQVIYHPYLYYPVYLSADCAEGIAQPFAVRIAGVYPIEQ